MYWRSLCELGCYHYKPVRILGLGGNGEWSLEACASSRAPLLATTKSAYCCHVSNCANLSNIWRRRCLVVLPQPRYRQVSTLQGYSSRRYAHNVHVRLCSISQHRCCRVWCKTIETIGCYCIALSSTSQRYSRTAKGR